MSALSNVAYFLCSLFFSLAIALLWIKLFLRFFHVSSLHPLHRSISNLTDPLTRFIAILVPGQKNRQSSYDWPCFILLILVELLKFTLLSYLAFSRIFPVSWLLLYTAADLVLQPARLLFYALIIRVLMSWINPLWNHPIADLIRLLIDPLLRFFRRYIPLVSGFDLSPLALLILLEVLDILIRSLLPIQFI